MSKKILVTGSNGLLGQKLTDMLRYHSDYELIASSKGENRYPETEGYTYEQLDVTDYYLDSPDFTLDQDNTYKAIESLQLFINMYPKSERVSECNQLIDLFLLPYPYLLVV